MSGSNPSFANPLVPSIGDYTIFVRSWGVTSTYLPNNSIWLTITFNVATAIVNRTLQCTDPLIYTLAIYNLAMDRLVNYAQDQTGLTYFKDLRGKDQYNLQYAFAPGVPSSTGDQGTSVGLLNPEWMQTLTIQDLQTLRTPWGREYMAFAQSYGNLWGLS
jgi:hypothetical protein